jgi:hypothetical protein
VLFVGRWNADLAAQLHSTGSTLAALVFDREAASAANQSCAMVETLDASSWSIPESIRALRYDAIVLDGALELSPNPESMLAEIRELLQSNGFVAVSLPHTAHGAIRLALMRGNATDAFAGVASAREAVELFERCGYRVQRVDRVMAPLFEHSEGLPSLEQSDFDPSVIQEIRSDPESETASFVVFAGLVSDAAPEAVDEIAGDDRYVVPFETAFEAQRRQTQLEEELRAALREADRLRGRVIALEDALNEQSGRHERPRKHKKE